MVVLLESWPGSIGENISPLLLARSFLAVLAEAEIRFEGDLLVASGGNAEIRIVSSPPPSSQKWTKAESSFCVHQ